ncbi:hypothetical protein [Lysobacter capsici]|uniref:hypothetical protein n=1 Tax=Lysobacter capsici TaxID=435897 RepID=UPI001C003130|nr:hypothetical protein [Lysobacter capsici]QWF16385.1 hypothetical protein KME82_21930 [Lysobacter capsici]
MFAERRDATGRFESMGETELLANRDYRRFSFMAGVRNEYFFNIVPISEPRGFPLDVSAFVREQAGESDADTSDIHSRSWLTVDELLTFDYDAPLRFSQRGRPQRLEADTYRDFLDEGFHPELELLQALGVERLVFWFDN